MEQPEPRRGGGGRKTQKTRALLTLRYDVITSDFCYYWHQRAVSSLKWLFESRRPSWVQPLRTFLHQPPRSRTPASPHLRVSVNRSCFHLGLTCIFTQPSTLVGGAVFPCRGVSAEHAASQTLPEEKGPQGNVKPEPRITCK